MWTREGVRKGLTYKRSGHLIHWHPWSAPDKVVELVHVDRVAVVGDDIVQEPVHGPGVGGVGGGWKVVGNLSITKGRLNTAYSGLIRKCMCEAKYGSVGEQITPCLPSLPQERLLRLSTLTSPSFRPSLPALTSSP